MKQVRKVVRTGMRLLLIALLVSGAAVSAWCAEADFDGTYAGSITGDDTGYWVCVIDSAGENKFIAYSPSGDDGDAGTLDYWGEPGGLGSFYTAATDIHGAEIDILIDPGDGSVSGTWENTGIGKSGDIEGDQISNSAYAGDASGSFAGDDTGTWTLTIGMDGYVTGTMTSDNFGASSFEGGCHPDGHILAIGDDGSGWFVVVADIAGSDIDGFWAAENDTEGTITGSIVLDDDDSSSSSDDDSDDSSSDGGGSSGGGGCFIRSLAANR